MRDLRDDPLPDLLTVRANWLALAAFGRAREPLSEPSMVTLHGIPLSQRTVALLYATPGWLQTLWSRR